MNELQVLLVLCHLALSSSLTGDNSTRNELPKYVHVCHKSDVKINDCLKKTIESIRPYLAEGIPKMGIPPCEPLIIPKVSLSQNGGAMSFSSDYTNITVKGSSKFEIKSVKLDTTKNRMRLRLWFPELQTRSIYNIKGNLLMMPLQGTGTCYGNYSDVDAVAAIRGEIVDKLELRYFKVKDLFIEFNVGHASVHLDNLFNGDPELGAAMNKFLNEHWRLIAGELRPALEDAISDLLYDVADKMFSTYSLNVLLPE